ncbi:MAG: F0F1 ATP synthase subunit B [Candidatus Peregrinibacteria bacterium]
MEALSKLGVEWPLLLAQTVNFLILFGVLSYFAYRPMLKFLDERGEKIEQGLKDAQAAKVRLEEVAKEESQILSDARREAKDLLIKADSLAKEKTQYIMSEAEDAASRFLEQAHKEAHESTRKMVSDAQKELASVIVVAVEKIVREKFSEGGDEAFLKKALADIKQ